VPCAVLVRTRQDMKRVALSGNSVPAHPIGGLVLTLLAKPE